MQFFRGGASAAHPCGSSTKIFKDWAQKDCGLQPLVGEKPRSLIDGEGPRWVVDTN